MTVLGSCGGGALWEKHEYPRFEKSVAVGDFRGRFFACWDLESHSRLCFNELAHDKV